MGSVDWGGVRVISPPPTADRPSAGATLLRGIRELAIAPAIRMVNIQPEGCPSLRWIFTTPQTVNIQRAAESGSSWMLTM